MNKEIIEMAEAITEAYNNNQRKTFRDRLTFKYYKADSYYYLEGCGSDYAHPKQSEAVQRLAAYENTDLTPEEIEELRADATALLAENRVLKERLENAVELPCKINDTVYLAHTKSQKEPFEFKIADMAIFMYPFGIFVEGLTEDGYLNESVFLTKAEAEARLKGEKE